MICIGAGRISVRIFNSPTGLKRCLFISTKELQINEEIRDKEIRVITESGEQLGIMSAKDAFKEAEKRSLDLVKIAPNAQPPVCKIMDYGKYRFDKAKKEKEAKKNQKTLEIKEIWLSMTIDVGDLNVKAKQTIKFLKAGNKVKVSIRMRGRQNAHSDLGVEVMQKFFTMRLALWRELLLRIPLNLQPLYQSL